MPAAVATGSLVQSCSRSASYEPAGRGSSCCSHCRASTGALRACGGAVGAWPWGVAFTWPSTVAKLDKKPCTLVTVSCKVHFRVRMLVERGWLRNRWTF